jgi:adenylylsulfate kinase
VGDRKQAAFAVWITGLPASGKSTIARALRDQLARQGMDIAVLESDAVRKMLEEEPSYDPKARARFYRYLAYAGVLLTGYGIPVIFDATANRRIYRACARQQIPRFIEVFIDCPLETCIARDPKRIYGKASEGGAQTVPGIQEPYEPPEAADIVIDSEHEIPALAAQRIVEKLMERGYVANRIPAPGCRPVKPG